jgi:signal transduction histidine kinase/ActR/RegA family two-component response regulator
MPRALLRLIPTPRQLPGLLALFVGWIALAKLGLLMPFMHGQASPMWPAAGLAIAALWLGGDALWLGAALAAFAVGWIDHGSSTFILGTALGTGLEALIALWLLRATGFRGDFARVNDVIALIAVSIVAGFVSAAAGVNSMHAAGMIQDPQVAEAMRVWWVGDFMGALVAAPLVLLAARYEPRVDRLPRALEIFALIVLFATASVLMCLRSANSGGVPYPLAFLFFPGIVWVALRFGPFGTALTNVLITLAAVTATLLGFGPFVVGSPVANLLVLQSYLGVLCLTGLTLAAVIAERETAAASLRDRERELRAAAADLNAVVQSVPDRYLWVDVDRGMVRRRMQAGADQPLPSAGMSVSQVLQPEISGAFRDACERCRRTGEVVSIEYKSEEFGETRHHEARHAPLPDGTVLIIVRDLTEQHRLHERLQQSQKMEAVGRLAGGVAHDFNNMLTAIRGYADLLSDSTAHDHNAQAWSAELLKAIERASTLTRRLLTLSRRQVVSVRPFDMSALVEDMGDMLRRLATERIDVVIDTGRREHWVTGDQAQIEQVIVNLVVNARDAMPEGGTLRLQLGAEVVDPDHWNAPPRLSAGAWVRLRVIDEGHGMDEATLSRAFEPFFTTKGPEHGSGLGLSIVYGIIQQAGGEIMVTSSVGRGTTVSVYLKESAPLPETSAPLVATAAPGGRGTVLLVEDDAMVRGVVLATLRRAGYQVLEAADGMSALKLAQSAGPIDLLLTDIVMPGLNGREVADRLRADRPGLSVLFMSGYADHAIFGAESLGPETPYLAKPFTASDLLSRIQQTLDARSTVTPV